MLSPPKPKKTDKQKYYEKLGRKETTSMECLAFDSMHKQNETQVQFTEPTDDVHRDIDDDEGPDW